MIETAVIALARGVWSMVLSTWWLFVILFGAKFGPRIVRGILLQRGGFR